MRFKADENLPAEVAAVLRDSGHDAVNVLDQHLGGASDRDLASLCRAERRTLLTLDLDFADLRSYPPKEHPGIVVFRLTRQDRYHVVDTVRRVAPLFQVEPLDGRLWIVTEDHVRIRS